MRPRQQPLPLMLWLALVKAIVITAALGGVYLVGGWLQVLFAPLQGGI